MNNEPVAWMFQGAFDISTYVSFEKPNPDIYPNPTPLYTHSAKEQELLAEIEGLKKDLKYFTSPCDPLCKPNICDCYKARFAISNRKTLTDEEIYEVWCDAIKEEAIVNKGKPPILKYQPFVFFARAILRKAQEK